MRKTSRQLAYLGLCTAVALILAYVEVLLPPLYTAVPGIKLGLPNIAILFVLYRYGMRYAAAVSFVRMAVIALLLLLLGTAELGYYLIVLAITGTVSGIFVGLCGGLAVRRIPGGNM